MLRKCIASAVVAVAEAVKIVVAVVVDFGLCYYCCCKPAALLGLQTEAPAPAV